jgi:hypothetical protein
MPMTYRIDPVAGVLYILAVGVVTQPERLRTFHAWLHDRDFRPGLDALCDFSDTESTPTLAQLRELIDMIEKNAEAIGRSRLAILTAKPITFGVARVFEALAEVEGAPIEVKVFFDRDEAWGWLRPSGPPSAA